MKWSSEAEQAVKKAPFFVRKKVRAAAESYVRAQGRTAVAAADVAAAKKRFLADMDSQVKGYQLDTCFGSSGCTRRAAPGDEIMARAEALLEEADLHTFLRRSVDGPLRFHHEFRVTVADCPNACSQPQIKDVGIIGGVRPGRTAETCTGCGDCRESCPDGAITIEEEQPAPLIDSDRCLLCGLCIQACPTGTLAAAESGFRVLLGGRLGRHPRLGLAVPGLLSADQVLAVLEKSIEFYKQNSRNGERFARLVSPADVEKIAAAAGVKYPG